MKIGLVCPYNILVGGGVQECVFALRDELKRRGHGVYILTPQPRRYTGEAPDGVLFIGKATKVKSFHTTTQISASAETDAVDSLLKKHAFDVLHFHEPWVPFVSRQILLRSQACNIATFHAKLPENLMNRTIEKVITPYTRSILNYLDALSAVSDAAADYVTSLTTRPIEIIPNGIDVAKYKHSKTTTKVKQPAQSPPKIMFVGRLERRKGITYLLDAFEELKASLPDAELHIAGTGPDERRLRRYITDNAISRVVFHGYVSEAKKIELMSQATVFCSPSPYGESFGIVLLEAMGLGVPIVAGNNPGYTSVMKERGTISVVDPKDTTLFAQRLKLFIADEAIRSAWRSWAMTYVQQFSYIKIVDAYELLYERACKQKKRG